MALVQLDLPDDLDKWIKIESIKRDINDKRLTIIMLLEEKKDGSKEEML